MDKPNASLKKAMFHLNSMLSADKKLYEQILDTLGFAYHFNELVKMAATSKTQNNERDTI